MKKILLFTGSVIVALVIASWLVYRFVDVGWYKDAITSSIKENTGYELAVGGDIRLRILPSIALDINDVTIKSSNGDKSENAISISKLIIHPQLLPLFRKEVAISSLKLVNPVFRFRIFKDGTNNFSKIAVNQEVQKVSASASVSSASEFDKNIGVIKNLLNENIFEKIRLEDFDVENGKLRFADERKGIDAHVDNVLFRTSFVPGENLFKISGKLKMDVGVDTPISLGGKYQFLKDMVDFSSIEFKFGDISAHGEAGIDLRPALPDAKVAFYFENLNLNPYAGLIDLLQNKNGAPKAANQGASSVARSFNWSQDAMDFGFLRNVNGQFNFKANKISYKDINVGIITLNSYLMNGKLIASLKEAEVFGGNITSELIVDATSSTPKIKNKINFEDIDLAKVQPGAGAATRLGGRLNGGALLTSRGVTEKELVGNVDGNLNLRVIDGVIEGLDLLGMAKNIPASFSIGKKLEQATKINDLSGSFDINKGVAQSEDVMLISDAVDFNGRGNINFPNLTVNFMVTPKLKRGTKEAGDVLGGLRAPILISGNLFQPSFKLEIQTLVMDLVKNPKGTEDLVKQIKNDFKDIKDNINSGIKNNDDGVVKNLKNILKGF
jgi:uncharacterized protein involved in outer membrane biogenesis